VAFPLATVQAQPAVKAARNLEEEGMALVGQRRYKEALTRFREARTLHPTSENTWSEARCLELLEEYTAAYDTFRESGRLTTERGALGKIEVKLRELEERTARVRIQVDTDGLPVSIAGRPVGLSPLKNDFLLTPGETVFEVVPANDPPIRKTVMLTRGTRSEVRLETASPPPPKGPDKTQAGPVVPPVVSTIPDSRHLSGLKAGLFFGGLGIALAGAGVQLWGWRLFANADDSRHTYAQKQAAADGAATRYYIGYGLYGLAAGVIVASFLVPSAGRHPLGWLAAPVPGGFVSGATLVW
jgi:hypothetical protein